MSNFEILIENKGPNFIRNVDLDFTENNQTSSQLIPVLNPGKKRTVTFKSNKPWTHNSQVCAAIDPRNKVIEGGLMKTNNKICLK